MIFTRRFGALAARPQFPDAPELQQELDIEVDLKQHDAKDGNQPITDGDRSRETTAA
jgi:hypothetical protein